MEVQLHLREVLTSEDLPIMSCVTLAVECDVKPKVCIQMFVVRIFYFKILNVFEMLELLYMSKLIFLKYWKR